MSKFNFSNKTIIISGGGTGIGFSIASAFVAHGANVVITGRRENVLKKAISQIKEDSSLSEKNMIYYKCDMSDEKSVSELFQMVKEKFNKIDIVVNNCGAWRLQKIQDINEDDIEYHFNNNFKATILGTKFSSIFCEKSGSIINIGSFSGILPMKNGSLYSSFKNAVISYTRSSAKELGKSGLRVNCVVPGVIRTPMTSQYIDKNHDKLIEPIALGRIGTCEEVANTVLFLCSDMASYISGGIIEVTGGKYLTQL